MALLATLAAVPTPYAAGDSSDSKDAAVPAVCYSTGKSGGRLTWLSQRPESPQAQNAVTAAQHVAPLDLPQPSSSAENQKPYLNSLGDPFDDGKTFVPTPAERPQTLAYTEQCPSPKDLKKVGDLTTNITPSAGELPRDCPLGDAVFQPRAFAPLTYAWTASGLCHKPLYFEDVQLERYGHMCGPWLQPFASGAHFFLTVPILPYKMGLEPPHECIYTLGYYRPGNCAPYMIDPLPLSVRAALFEAGAWVGGVFLIP